MSTGLAFLSKALADDLHAELAAAVWPAPRILVVAETEHGDRIERLWRHEGSAVGGRDRAADALAARWLAAGRPAVAAGAPGGVSRLELVPDQVVPDTGRQLGFWGGSSDAGEQAARALARLKALVGAESVLVPEWRGARAHGEQYRLVPLDAVDLNARPEPGPEPWRAGSPRPRPRWSGHGPAPPRCSTRRVVGSASAAEGC